jgi:hypothetical protein
MMRHHEEDGEAAKAVESGNVRDHEQGRYSTA